MENDSKQKALEFGLFAENQAADYYIKNGYTIRERRWKMGKTEIDLIAQKDDVIVLIEVKARNGKGEDALSAVNQDKRRRMIRAADNYLKGLQGSFYYRFDIVTCTGNIEDYQMEVYDDAFLAADLF